MEVGLMKIILCVNSSWIDELSWTFIHFKSNLPGNVCNAIIEVREYAKIQDVFNEIIKYYYCYLYCSLQA